MNRTELVLMGGIIGLMLSAALVAVVAKGLPDETRRNLKKAGPRASRRLKVTAGALIVLLTIFGAGLGLLLPPSK